MSDVINELILFDEYLGKSVMVRDDKAYTLSTAIAKVFEKRHDNTLQVIENLECSDKFRLLNFKESTYTNTQGRKQPMYKITRDGFVFLVMGFTGAKAARFKEAYIKRFNEMEEWITERVMTRIHYKPMTRAIKLFYTDPKGYDYATEADMINIIVTGNTSSFWKNVFKAKGLSGSDVIRNHFDQSVLLKIDSLQQHNTTLLLAGMSLDSRRALLEKFFKMNN